MNPALLESFCAAGTKEAIDEILVTLGWTPENPNINGNQYNNIFFQIFGYLNHLKSKGISFWENDRAYYATADNIDLVRSGNKIYFAKLDNNLDPINTPDPKDPATNPDTWGVLLDLDSPPSETFAKLAGDALQLFRVKAGVEADDAVNKAQLDAKADKAGDALQLFKVKAGAADDDAVNKLQLDGKASKGAANTFTAPQRSSIGAEDNAIDFSTDNNFSLTATAANITATNVDLCLGQSGVITILSAENITGWGAEFKFRGDTPPINLTGTEVFAYFIDSTTTIRIGLVQ